MLPVRKDNSSPIKKVKDSPIKNLDHESPAKKVNDSPIKNLDHVSPAKKVNDSPIKNLNHESPAKKVKDSPIKNLDHESPAKKVKISHHISTEASTLHSASVGDKIILQLRQTPALLASSSGTSESPLEKVKGSPVINVNESLAEKGKSNVSTVPRKLDFEPGKDEHILLLEETTAPVDYSTGTSVTPLVKVKDSPVKNLNKSPARKSKRSPNSSTVVSRLMGFRSKGILDSPSETHNRTTPGKNENVLPSEETMVSQDLFAGTGGELTDLLGFCTSLEDESRVFLNISSDLSKALPDSTNDLAARRRMTLCSGGSVIHSEAVVESDPFDDQQLARCFYCRSNYFVYEPIPKYKLECFIHGGPGSSQSDLDTEICYETILAQLSETEYQRLQYQCAICSYFFYDLHNFKCHLKCSHCLNDVTLCQKCLPLFQ